MEKEMLEMFIYYVMALEKEGTENYSINGCIKVIEKALDIITNESFGKWNEWLMKFSKGHPVVKKQSKLMCLNEEEYKKMLKETQKLMKNYCLRGGTLNYDSLYLVASEKDVETLAYQIILKNKTTAKIKELLEENSKKIDANKNEMAILVDELCLRYYYGDDTEKNYNEAIKGWEMVADYIKDAKYMLAIAYKNGTGVTQSKEKAYQIFNEISKDDIRAKYQVALMNYKGVGTEQNYKKTLEIFKELKGKSPFDMDKWIDFYMGEIYFYGLGIERNKNKGLELMESAWNNGIALKYAKIKKVLEEYYN